MIRAKQPSQETIIDLTGPDGNAFNLIGLANKLGKQLGIDTKELQANMMSGDYENLIQEFDKVFGDYITLER